MGDIGQKIVQPVRRILQNINLIQRLPHHPAPFPDHQTGYPTHQRDDKQMKRNSTDYQFIKIIILTDHFHDIISESDVISNQTEIDQGRLPRHRINDDDRCHHRYDIEGAGQMNPIEKKCPHHQQRIDPETDALRNQLSDVENPRSNQRGRYYNNSPQLPLHQEGFDDQRYTEQRITDQDNRMRCSKQFILVFTILHPLALIFPSSYTPDPHRSSAA